jgi:hypothetical protein
MRWITVVSLLIISTTFAQQTPFVNSVSNVGTQAGAFLGIGVGARATAMGGAYTAIADDAAALYWNPAGLANTRQIQFLFHHNDWFLDISHDFVGVTVPAGDHFFGAQITYLGVPDQEIRTIAEPEGTGKFYNASDVAIGLSYAYQFTDRFAMGFTAKYIGQRIYNSSGFAMAVDFGAQYRPSAIEWLRLGMQIANFGSDIQLSGHALDIKVDTDPQHYSNDNLPAELSTDVFALPLIFRFGMAFVPVDSRTHKLTGSVDLIHPSNNTESLNVGAEYEYRGFLALRSGYYGLLERDFDESGGLTAGVGLKIYAGGALLAVDYAYQAHLYLDSVNRFSLMIAF